MATKTKTVEQASDYRSALLAERARLTGAKPRDLEVLILSGPLAVDDQAALAHDQFVALRRHGIDRQKLKLIDAALARLDRGEFGRCAACDEPIPAKRLQVMPWAVYCVPCQEEADAARDDEADEQLQLIA